MAAETNTRATTAQTPGSRSDALDEALTETFPASDPVAMSEPSGGDVDAPVVTQEVKARQGVTGHNVRYVLGYGLAGIVVAFVILYLTYRA